MKNFLIFLLMLGVVGLTGCNTLAGAGKDVSATGDAIHDTAEDAKPK